MQKEDFDWVATPEGYTIYYKGQSIGVASIKGKCKLRGTARLRQMKDYSSMAEREVNQLIKGNGTVYMKKQVNRIDASNVPFPQPVIFSMG